ncbi:MAG: hypothetical protein V1912_02760 [bacterium]
MNQGGAPIYTARGARPRPTPDGASGQAAWRQPILLAVVMVGWMFFVLALAAIAAPAGTGGETTVQIGRDVTIIAPGGWTSAGDVWEVGSDAVSLQKAGALVAFAAEVYDGTDQELLADIGRQLRTQFDPYRALPAASATIAGDIPALVVLFSGTADSGRLEGELVVAVTAPWRTGVVMLAVAPAGQLRRVQGDLDSMLGTMVVPR